MPLCGANGILPRSTPTFVVVVDDVVDDVVVEFLNKCRKSGIRRTKVYATLRCKRNPSSEHSAESLGVPRGEHFYCKKWAESPHILF